MRHAITFVILYLTIMLVLIVTLPIMLWTWRPKIWANNVINAILDFVSKTEAV